VTKAKPETPGTAPVHLVLQVTEALRMHQEETLERVQARHSRMAELARQGAAALGLGPQCAALRQRSTTVTRSPFRPTCPVACARWAHARGILTAAASIDTSHRHSGSVMGDIREDDVRHTLDALGQVIAELRA
jgi:aspartate aminotransferase-like enzyme